MVMCLRERGCVNLAGTRGCSRTYGMTGRLSQPDGSDRKLALMQFPTASASSYTGGVPGVRGMLEFAGKSVAYALVGARVGSERWRRLPGLMVAINRCDHIVGRITHGAISVN